MKVVLLSALAVSLAVYAWAIRRVFAQTAQIALGMRALQLLGAVFGVATMIVFVAIDSVSMMQGSVALAVYALALWIFSAARHAIAEHRLTLAFSDDVPQQLVQHGIYRLVRHPFYLAYSLTWIAGVVAVPHPITASACLVMLPIYWTAARFEEQKFLRSDLAAHYSDYARRTGMLWPAVTLWLRRN